MDAQEIQAFLRQHWELFQMGIGVLCLIGAVRDWDWLCGAAGTRQAGSPFGRTGRRVLEPAEWCCSSPAFGWPYPKKARE